MSSVQGAIEAPGQTNYFEGVVQSNTLCESNSSARTVRTCPQWRLQRIPLTATTTTSTTSTTSNNNNNNNNSTVKVKSKCTRAVLDIMAIHFDIATRGIRGVWIWCCSGGDAVFLGTEEVLLPFLSVLRVQDISFGAGQPTRLRCQFQGASLSMGWWCLTLQQLQIPQKTWCDIWFITDIIHDYTANYTWMIIHSLVGIPIK